jgi:hypothetical protein
MSRGITRFRQPRHNMGLLLRRLRGIVGIGLSSAFVWACVGALLGAAVLVIDPAAVDAGEGPGWIAYYFGRAGFVAGAVAAAVLTTAEARKTFVELNYGRMALWGAIGGLVLPWLAVAPRPMLPMFLLLGAGTACATLAVARRAERHALRPSATTPAQIDGAAEHRGS